MNLFRAAGQALPDFLGHKRCGGVGLRGAPKSIVLTGLSACPWTLPVRNQKPGTSDAPFAGGSGDSHRSDFLGALHAGRPKKQKGRRDENCHVDQSKIFRADGGEARETQSQGKVWECNDGVEMPKDLTWDSNNSEENGDDRG